MELNNIYLGNAYELIKQVPNKSVDLIVTDPPYNIKDIHKSGIMKDRAGSFMEDIASTNLDKGIDLKILDDLVRVLKKINIYIWCNKEQIYNYLTYFVKERGCNWEMIVWSKNAPVPFCGTHYLVDKEYCLYFWETGAEIHVPFDRAKTVYITDKNLSDKKTYKHPTIKPLNIIKNLILNSSVGGAVILDPFVGSGTTCVAAKELGRQYIGFEINETYYKTAVDRLKGTNQQKEAGLFEQISLFD